MPSWLGPGLGLGLGLGLGSGPWLGLGSGLESWSVVRVRVRLGVRVRVGPPTYLRGRHVRSRSSAAARAAGELNESSRAGAEGGWCGLEEGACADRGPTRSQRRSPQQPRRRSRAVRSEAAGPDARGLHATTRLGLRCVRCAAPSSRVTISGRGWASPAACRGRRPPDRAVTFFLRRHA